MTRGASPSRQNSPGSRLGRPADARRTIRPPGYTLIEMLVVLFIISILGALILAGVSAARLHSQIKRQEAQMNLLRAKIDEYETDFHDYPPTDGIAADGGIDGSERLFQALMTNEKNGPYISLADFRTCDENGNGSKELSDVWGNAVRYLHHKSYGRENPNRRTYRLWSLGPDKQEDIFNPTSDDLVNWKKGAEGESDR